MNSDTFLNVLGQCPGNMADGSGEAFDSLWNREMSQAIDTITLSHDMVQNASACMYTWVRIICSFYRHYTGFQFLFMPNSSCRDRVGVFQGPSASLRTSITIKVHFRKAVSINSPNSVDGYERGSPSCGIHS